jgi:hypothetical protein
MNNNKNKSWDRNQWQGRSRRQVENNYKVTEYMVKTFIIAIGLYALSELITYFI